MKTVLRGMLELDPEKRISPRRVLEAFDVKLEPDRVPFY